MRLVPRIALALMSTTVVLPAAAQDTAHPGAPDSGAVVRKLADGVFAVIRKEPLGLINESNTLFIIGSRDVIVVDAQSSTARTRETLALLRTLTDKPVSTVVNTHWHDDHVVGNAVYRETFPSVSFVGAATNAEDMATTGVAFRNGGVRARKGTVDFLRGLASKQQSFLGGPSDALEARSYQLAAWLVTDYSDADSTIRPIAPTRTVTDRLVLDQGNRKVEVLFLGRGHTRGDLVVFLPAERILAAGDLVMWPVTFVGSTSYPSDFATTLEKLRALSARQVVPGHGPVLSGAQADSQASLVAETLRSIDSQVRAAIKRGQSLEQARKSVDLSSFERRTTRGSRLNAALFDYYVRQSAVARAYELDTAAAHQGAATSVIQPDSMRFSAIVNGRSEVVDYRGRRAVHLLPAPETNGTNASVLAVLDAPDFRNGTIDIDVAGAPRPGAPPDSRGFIGIAFRTEPAGAWSEIFYLRPTNARADDQLRRNHTAQYVSEPDFPWPKLRQENPGVYESYADMEPAAWTSMRIVVSGTTARLYVNGATQPCLIVNDLKRGDVAGRIALWAHVETAAYFGAMKINRD